MLTRLQPLASVSSARLEIRGVSSTFIALTSRPPIHSPLKLHSHPGHGTNVTPPALLALLHVGFEPAFLSWEAGALTRMPKTTAASVSS